MLRYFRRFSLKSLLVLILIACVASLIASRYFQFKHAIATIRETGGEIMYQTQNPVYEEEFRSYRCPSIVYQTEYGTRQLMTSAYNSKTKVKFDQEKIIDENFGNWFRGKLAVKCVLVDLEFADDDVVDAIRHLNGVTMVLGKCAVLENNDNRVFDDIRDYFRECNQQEETMQMLFDKFPDADCRSEFPDCKSWTSGNF